jgi:cell fate regulator YaaT (PSP1 superfamily)|uniref:Stage 0 sporulation protein n=1 Tax=Thermodesulfobacterium geofontis TaxID=1295609 RepID=A0A7V5K1T8_9BACT
MYKKENTKGIWLSLGTLKKGFPDQVLKLNKPLPKGNYVLAKLPDGRREIFILTESSYKIPFDVEGVPFVVRKATFKEIKEYETKLEIEEKGKEFCLQFAKDLGIEMNLVRVDCFFNRSKIIFYYTAEGRIDFRQLVKELARALRMRIEMRQIGVRNETALVGGIGYCGKEFCCARFLRQFIPLSIRMAKEQGLILDPNKISGPCGRLLCCLAYEEDLYKEFLQDLPKMGNKIRINGESYKILKYNLFQKVAYLENKDGQIIQIPVSQIKTLIEEETEETIEEEKLKELDEG